jgi:hypothetical protein
MVDPAAQGDKAIVYGFESIVDLNHPALCQSNQRVHARLHGPLHGAMFAWQRQALVRVSRVTQW